MHLQDPTYDLGWDMGPPAAPLVADTTIDLGSGDTAGDQDDEGPLYNLGWGATTSVVDAAVEDEEGPSYNLGWG
jgi:hypothetical protein